MGLCNTSVVERYDEETGTWDFAEIGNIFDVPDSYEPVYGKNTTTPFTWRSSAVASFIAGIRNSYCVEPIAEGRGLPEGHKSVEDYEDGIFLSEPPKKMRSRYDCEFIEGHNTWVLLSELLNFDYEQTFEDRRSYGDENHEKVAKGHGVLTTYKEHLGELFFKDLEILKALGKPDNIRVVWSFY